MKLLSLLLILAINSLSSSSSSSRYGIGIGIGVIQGAAFVATSTTKRSSTSTTSRSITSIHERGVSSCCLPSLLLSSSSSASSSLSLPSSSSSSSSLMMSKSKRPDTSKEIQDAIRLSKEYGPDSKEAKVAWDIVEEMDASDSMREAFEPIQKQQHDSKDSLELIHQIEYVNYINDITNILSNVVLPTFGPMKTLIHNLEELSTKDPEATKLGPMPEVLANALAEAKVEFAIHDGRRQRFHESEYGDGDGDRDDGDDYSSSYSNKAWRSLKIAQRISEHLEQYKGVDDYYENTDEIKHRSSSSTTTKTTPSLSSLPLTITPHHEYTTVLNSKALNDARHAVTKLEHFMRLLAIEKNRLSQFVHHNDDDLDGNSSSDVAM